MFNFSTDKGTVGCILESNLDTSVEESGSGTVKTSRVGVSYSVHNLR